MKRLLKHRIGAKGRPRMVGRIFRFGQWSFPVAFDGPTIFPKSIQDESRILARRTALRETPCASKAGTTERFTSFHAPRVFDRRSSSRSLGRAGHLSCPADFPDPLS